MKNQRFYRQTRLEKIALISPEIPRSWVTWLLETPIKTCKQWNQNRQRQVPESVIEEIGKVIANFPPTLSEGFITIYPVKPGYLDLKILLTPNG